MVYDTRIYSSTQLVQNQVLIESLLSKNPTWTEADARRRIDQAWTVMEGCMEKKNRAREIHKHDGNCCMDCGSINLTPTGSCRACLDCGASQGCS